MLTGRRSSGEGADEVMSVSLRWSLYKELPLAVNSSLDSQPPKRPQIGQVGDPKLLNNTKAARCRPTCTQNLAGSVLPSTATSFDTANRKRAAANIFEKVNQDALMRLFQKNWRHEAEERVRSIFSFAHDPEEDGQSSDGSQAEGRKDKFLRICGDCATLLKLRWASLRVDPRLHGPFISDCRWR